MSVSKIMSTGEAKGTNGRVIGRGRARKEEEGGECVLVLVCSDGDDNIVLAH